ncbi:MAG TPA: carbohydrate kinase family protein [Candidatus Saccharimonadales bacterium]|nr:carbohydrate kinase family protein [Candidatus Saccharimonadales bacterium]
MKVVLVGHVCIDSNTSEQSSYTGWGSSLMYMAAYFRTHTDIDPVLIAPYGADFQKYSKGLCLIATSQGKRTLVYKNVTHDGRRTQWCDHVNTAKPVPLSKEVRQSVAEADVIVLAPLLPNYSIEYIAELFLTKKPTCLTVLLPQGFLRSVDQRGKVLSRKFEEAAGILPLFDLVVLSEDDVHGDVREAHTWAKLSQKTNIIMTQGAGGASLVMPQGLVRAKTKPIPEEQIIDSVGCGDTFSAAAMISYFATKDVMVAMIAGNEAASAKLCQASPTRVF